jgi:hypothetical protein
MISRRAEAGRANTRLLPAWIARGSPPVKQPNILLSIGLSSTCRRSDPVTAGRRKRTLAAMVRTPMPANAAQSGSRQSAPSVTPGRIGSSLASMGTCAPISSAACASRTSGGAAPGFKRGGGSWIKSNQSDPSLDQRRVGGQQFAVRLGNPPLGDEGHANLRLQEKLEHVVSHVQDLGNRLEGIARWTEIDGGGLLAFAAQLLPQLCKRIGVKSDLAFARVRQVAAGVTVAALVGAAGRQVDRGNVCQARQAGGREHLRFSSLTVMARHTHGDHLSHATA